MSPICVAGGNMPCTKGINNVSQKADCSMCAQRGLSSIPCLKTVWTKKASIQQLWCCRGPPIHCCNCSSIKSLMSFLLRDDREAGHLLISAIRERLGSPAGEAINGSREETSIKRRREEGHNYRRMTRLRWVVLPASYKRVHKPASRTYHCCGLV